jgi:cation:H+ antiporter
MEGLVGQVGRMCLAVVGLWAGARLLVDSAVRLAQRVGLAEITIGLTIVALGTSAPELVVTADAAVKGLGDIAVGNVLGSNIYNLAFVLGFIALVRPVQVRNGLLKRDGLALLASTVIAGLAVVDLTVTRIEGGILLALLVGYTIYLLRTGQAAEDDTTEATVSDAVTSDLTDRVSTRWRDPVLLLVGLAVVLVSGDTLVRAATTLASDVGISKWVIGGTIVAAGTATPEVAISLVALRRGSQGISIGNIVGSNVFNLLGVLGVGAVLRPLSVSDAALYTLGWLLVVSALVVATLRTGRVLSRVEGALFALSEVLRWVLGLSDLLG